MFKNLKANATILGTAILTSPLFVSATGTTTTTGYDGGLLNEMKVQDRGEALGGVSTMLTDFLAFVRGAGIIVCVIMLAWCAIQLAMSSGNQQKRQLAMEGIKNVLIAVAIIGSATLISGIAYNLLAVK